MNRAFAITQMLIHDHDISEDQIEWIDSSASTDGNIIAIKKHMEQSNLRSVIVTNDYHIPRSLLFAQTHDIVVPLYPAEAFLLADEQITTAELEADSVKWDRIVMPSVLIFRQDVISNK